MINVTVIYPNVPDRRLIWIHAGESRMQTKNVEHKWTVQDIGVCSGYV
jgi:hypothetical protein